PSCVVSRCAGHPPLHSSPTRRSSDLRRIVADPDVHAAIAIVTTFDRDDYLFSALYAGAGGFLLKNSSPEDLVAAVRVLAAGDGIDRKSTRLNSSHVKSSYAVLCLKKT